MADASPIANQVLFQSLGIGPEQQAKLLAAQQQEAYANALLQQGQTPIDTNNRSIGGVGYKISPWEGIAKLADTLSGKYQQNNANTALANALVPQKAADNISGNSGDNPAGLPVQSTQNPPQGNGGNMFYNADGSLTAMGQYQISAGNRAVAEMRPSNVDPLVTATIGGVEKQIPRSQYLALLNGGGQAPTSPQINPMSGTPMVPGQAPPSGAPPSPQAVGDSAIQQGALPISPPSPGTQLSGPHPSGSLPILPSSSAIPQAPPQIGKVILTPQQDAALKVQTAGATKQAEAAGAGSVTQAEDNAKNLTDAQKTFNVAASNFPRAMQRFSQLRQSAPNASFGSGVDEEAPGSMFGDYARNYARSSMGQYMEPKTALANQVMDQATKQGVLSELGPQLAGLKGNKFLEGIASGASGLNLADPPAAKLNAINGLQDQYISNMKSLATQRRNYGDPQAPTDMELASIISKGAQPNDQISVLDPQGRPGKVAAAHLTDLIQAGGQIR